MKFRIPPCLLLASALITSILPIASGAEKVELRVMTFNLRYASPQPPNAWPQRRPAVKDVIRKYEPDVVGTQEGLYRQLLDIAEDLDDYAWIGEGRNGGSAGEFMAVLYRTEKLEPRAYGHLWLSDTPDLIGSRTWGNGLPRMATWVRFIEKKSGLEFYFWNTHFDHQSQPAREKSAQLLISKIRERQPPRPVIVTGDFNHPQGNIVHQTLLSPMEAALNLSDVWDKAEKREGDQVGTFHGFLGGNPANGNRIDWILTSPEFQCRSARVVVDKKGEQYPSDHFPVFCELEVLAGESPAIVLQREGSGQ